MNKTAENKNDNTDYKDLDPLTHMELRNQKPIGTKPIGTKPMRRIYRRTIALSILYTFITFGIYLFFWQYEIANETNGISKERRSVCPSLVVFLSIITFGIYGCVWAYQLGKQQNQFYLTRFNIQKDYHALYLVLHIVNYLVPFLTLICYCIMQSRINEMLKISDSQDSRGIYIRDHSLFNKPILSTFLFVLIGTNIISVVSSWVNSILNVQTIANNAAMQEAMRSGGDALDNLLVSSAAQEIIEADTMPVIVRSISCIIVGFLFLWWFKLRFKHSPYNGVLGFKKFGWACLYAIPGLILIAINLFDFEPSNFKIGIVIYGFVPGVIEEVTFRGTVVPNFLRVYNSKKGVWLALFISAGIFGLIHISNVFAGADLGTSIFQAFYCFALGILLAAILIRTGCLWSCILIHGLLDATALMSVEALSQGAVQTQALVFDLGFIIEVVISLVLIVCGLIIVRPSKHKDIINLWSDKWGDAVINT